MADHLNQEAKETKMQSLLSQERPLQFVQRCTQCEVTEGMRTGIRGATHEMQERRHEAKRELQSKVFPEYEAVLEEGDQLVEMKI